MGGGFNAVNVGMLTVGAIMIYAGAKDMTLKQAIQDLINRSKTRQTISGTGQGGGSSFHHGHAGGGGGGGGGNSW